MGGKTIANALRLLGPSPRESGIKAPAKLRDFVMTGVLAALNESEQIAHDAAMKKAREAAEARKLEAVIDIDGKPKEHVPRRNSKETEVVEFIPPADTPPPMRQPPPDEFVAVVPDQQDALERAVPAANSPLPQASVDELVTTEVVNEV